MPGVAIIQLAGGKLPIFVGIGIVFSVVPFWNTSIDLVIRIGVVQPKQPNPKQNNQKRSKTDWWGVCDGILGHACPKCLMSSLVFDTTSREAEGAVEIIIWIDVARVEAQVVSGSRSVGCGHPAVTVGTNCVELAIGCITTAASGEECVSPCVSRF